MSIEDLEEILAKHLKWIRNERGGERAYLECANLEGAYLEGAFLCGANLRGAYLECANLEGAYLEGVNLCGAYLEGAYLCGANLEGANLRGAFLCGANLRGANLRGAYLEGVNLCGAYLCGANLERAFLCGANLERAYLRGAKNIPFIACVPPDSGAFIGWKKAKGLIVKLLIPEDARRSSATTRQCRCDKAKVLAIENIDGTPYCNNEVSSDYDNNFVYKVGKKVKVDDFCEDRWIECARGIHFFVNRQEAVNY